MTSAKKSPTPTQVLADFLRQTHPGDAVTRFQMAKSIGRDPKTYIKHTRRKLAAEDIFFEIVDGEGLRRIDGRIVNKGLKVELVPSDRKRDLLYKNARFARFVWNWALAQHEANGWPVGGKRGAKARREAVEARKRGEKNPFPPKLTKYELSRRWTQLVREDPELAWTKECMRTVVSYVLESLDSAYQHAFRRMRENKSLPPYRRQPVGWPKFKKRGSRRIFTIQDQSFRYSRNKIKLGKLGMIKVGNARRHYQLDALEGARVLRLAVSEKAGRWWCSIMYERQEKLPERGTGKLAGVDLGYTITVFDGTDDPPVYEPPRALGRYMVWLQHWSKASSRRQPARGEKPSKRYLKAKRMVASIHLQISNIRKDWIEKVSHDLWERYDFIVTEGFDVRRFVQHEVGYRKGRRTILDIGWGMLRTRVDAKGKDRGKKYWQLGKHDLSDQTCCKCGAKDSRRDGLFRCPNQECGYRAPRPKNTAELMYRIGTGDPPPNFGVKSPETPVGEAGVNARGDGSDLGRSRSRSAFSEKRVSPSP